MSDTARRLGGRAGARVGDWVVRHRDRLENGREAVQVIAIVAPPPMRLGLAAAALALDGAVTFADSRRGSVATGKARMKGARLAVEGLAMAATARFAPAVLARQAGRITALRRVVAALEQRQGRGGV